MTSLRHLQIRRLQPGESRELRAWIAERHYLRSAPPGYRVALEVLLAGERIGGLLLGRPAARSLDERLWLELTRAFFVDDTPANVESQGLAMMRRWVRVWMPGRRDGKTLPYGGDDLFWLTPAGARAALLAGERLDPEDFPDADAP